MTTTKSIPSLEAFELDDPIECEADYNKPRDPTCLTYWFPKILEAGLPVPKTSIIHGNEEQLRDLYELFDCREPKGPIYELIANILSVMTEFGFPCF